MTQRFDYFISGKWRNRDNIIQLTENIRKKGYSVYSFLEEHNNENNDLDNPEEYMKHFENRNWKKDKSVKNIFLTDMQAERNSDNFILLLPAGKSCHIEAGVAYGLGKKCILIGEQKEAESLYLIFQEIYNTEEEFLNTI
jgi:mRNA-degrading endonuclease HigB of HigAB toxin-antitoxin module